MKDFPEFKDYLHDYLGVVKERYTKENFKGAGLIPTQKLIIASIDQHVKIAQRNYHMAQLEELERIEASLEKEKAEWKKYSHYRKIVLSCVAWEICNASFLILHNDDTSTIWVNFHLAVAIAVGVAFSIMIRPFISMFLMDLAAMKRCKEAGKVADPIVNPLSP